MVNQATGFFSIIIKTKTGQKNNQVHNNKTFDPACDSVCTYLLNTKRYSQLPLNISRYLYYPMPVQCCITYRNHWAETGLVDIRNEEDQKKLDIFLCILPNQLFNTDVFCQNTNRPKNKVFCGNFKSVTESTI